ncbi:MAG: hypothetical protein UMR38_02365 [Candidatus Izemoplasma sp.]|nr:hypothetical protein [Candidatus Izemoplasma sp.]
MRLAIYNSKGPAFQKIVRFLRQKGYKINIIKQVTSHTIKNHEILIFHEELQIPNLIKVIEQIVLEQSILVLYAHEGKTLHRFYNVQHHPFFIDINIKSLHIEWDYKVVLAMKYIKTLMQNYQEIDNIKSELSALKMEVKAKRFLMNKGLSEAESHRFIQRKAMQLRKSKKDVVNLIIENEIDFTN